MKYRLYVSGCCDNTRDLESYMGIGGVILSDNSEEFNFSKGAGKGTAIEAHIHAIIYGIQELSNNVDVSGIEVYSTNLMIINYMNNKIIEIPSKLKPIIKSLVELTENIKIDIYYNYYDIYEYRYVRNLAEEALSM